MVGWDAHLTLLYFWFIFIDIISVTSVIPCEIFYTGTVEVSFNINTVGRAVSDLRSEFCCED